MGETSSPFRWSAGCIIATPDAQPERQLWIHTTSGASLSCAHWAGRTRLPRSTRAWQAVGNPREGPSSVRWVTLAIISARISRRITF